MIPHLIKELMRRKISRTRPKLVSITQKKVNRPDLLRPEMLTFEETVAQMNRGYENSQRVIQFLDTKAAAVIAFSVGLFAFVANMIAWVYEKSGPNFYADIPKAIILLGIVSGLTILTSGFFCLFSAFNTVRPRGLPSTKYFTILFPARSKEDKASINYLKEAIEGKPKEFVLEEFKKQLEAVGLLLYAKIRSLRISIFALIFQGLASVVLGGIIGLSAVLGYFEKADSQSSFDFVHNIKATEFMLESTNH